MLSKRVKLAAWTIVLGGTTTAALAVGIGSASASTSVLVNTYQGTFPTSAACEFQAGQDNSVNHFPNSAGEFFYCGSAGGRNLWLKHVV